ncbi:sigma-70 family RNA polymerase sigma factor [Pediococcus siamensis]|uniref:sigma-70 family RNA polymerase sigma factor n=1 Tax=Pediococcus siamensis TaxID=381829 RepID=UPI0039A2CD2A
MTNENSLIELSEEKALITKAKSGDSASFERLFHQYAPIVIHIQKKYFLRGYDLDDWLQEGRIIFFNTIANYDPHRHITLGKYFRTNFQNRVYSLIRREMAFKRRSNLFCNSLEAMKDDGSEYERLFMTKHGGPHELAVLKEDCRQYQAELSDFEAQVSHYFFSGKRPAEIAELLACEESRIANAISRCRSKFAQSISWDEN